MISKHSFINDKSQIGKNLNIDAFSVIHENVEIGDNCWIGSNVTIFPGARIGNNCKIFPGSVISGEPQDLKFENGDTLTFIGNNTIIRECVTINRATMTTKKTIVGSNCFIMAYCHIAHDCEIHDEVVLVNNASLAGCVKIEKGAILGGFSLVHQFCKVGQYSFSAMGSSIGKDIPAFVRVSGSPAFPRGLNTTGIQRLNLGKEVSDGLKEAYKILYLRNFKLKDAINEISKKLNKISEVEILLDSIKASERGIVR